MRRRYFRKWLRSASRDQGGADRLRESGHRGEGPHSSRAHLRVERVQPDGVGDGRRDVQLVGGDVLESRHDVGRCAATLHVVLEDHVGELDNAIDEVGGLNGDELTLAAELHDDPIELRVESMEQCGALDEPGDVAHRHGVVHLETGQSDLGLVEPSAEAFERVEALVGLPVERRRGPQLEPIAVEEDDRQIAPLLRDGEHRLLHLLGEPFGGAETGTGLVRADGRVGDEVDVGTHQVLAVAVDDDAAVHLRQLGEERSREAGRLEKHAAGADLGNLRVESEHDEGARAGADDELDRVTQHRSGCELAEDLEGSACRSHGGGG